jgi:SMI1 / KNR4 family (SUKH-1)
MVVRTLTGLSYEIDGRVRDAVRWPGWRHHGGRLPPPLTEIDLARLELEVGPLPGDYRQFLLQVAGAGAGPGYGLLSPAGAAQRQLARGTFSWQDGESPARPPAGVLALAHGGCGIMWLLVLRGPGCGEVWCDAISSDGKVRRVSESFSAWYRDWIDSAVSDSGPWCSWDGLSCATASVLVQLLESVDKEGPPPDPVAPRLAGRVAPGKLSLLSGGGPYFPAKAPLYPCHSCVAICENQGLTDEVFGEGVPPGPGGDEPPDGPAGGLVGRWARKLGWGKS